MKTDVDLRKMLFSNINLSGGYSGLIGIDQSVEFEVNELLKEKKLSNYLINVKRSSDPSFSAWKGGAILSQIMEPSMWISKSDYQDYGCNVLYL